MKISGNNRGFTLLELIIVVGIIGVLAAIAIPTFMRYRTKAKQAEVKLNLKAIYTSEISYYTEKNLYTNDFNGLDWQAKGDTKYRYTIGGALVGNPSPGGSPMNNAVAAAGYMNFTAVAWSNIDADPAVDTWQSMATLPLENTYSDTREEEAF